MKFIRIMFILFLVLNLLVVNNCQQPGGSGGGGSGEDDNSDNKSSLEVIKVAAGGDHTVAIISDGTVKCWGLNFEGELGYGDTEHRGDNMGEMGNALPTVNLGTGRTAKEVAAGYYHTTAVLDDGTVKCWGRNFWGQLGYGNTEDRGDEPGEMGDALPVVNLGTGKTAVQIAAGVCHTVVLLNDGTVKCWGYNNSGQLGYGDTLDRGDESGEMGDALPTVNLGSGRTAVQIAAGYDHTIVLLDNGTVKCWGDNGSGQLGYGDIEVRGDEPGEMGNSLPTVNLGTGRTAVQIIAGDNFTAVLLDNGTVKCWGDNHCGQLGYEDTENRGDGPGEMGDALPAVNLGTGRTAVQISAGEWFMAVILDNNTVKCWGHNFFGQLGYGDTFYRGDNLGEMGNSLPLVDLGTSSSIKKIIASRYNTTALYKNGAIKCWGDNGYGQLGYGDEEDIGDEPGEMGNNLPFVSLW